jgi:hypothetical protein
MMRFSVRMAFGLSALLIAPSFVIAQVARDPMSPRDRQPSRAFSRIDFGAGRPASRPVSRPPGAFDRMLATEGVRLPEITAAPEPHGTTVPCVMRIVPVDPRQKSNMPVVNVDKRADPKSVITIPTCQPRD